MERLATPLQISFENLSYSVRVPTTQSGEDKVILHNLSGTFRPGRVTAILGPSGSGKSTLLNILAGLGSTSGSVSGSIWINGREASGASLRQLAGFVHQDDIILATQTVKEAISMSVILRPPPLSSFPLPQQSPETVITTVASDGVQSPGSRSGGGRPEVSSADLLPHPVTTKSGQRRVAPVAAKPHESHEGGLMDEQCTHALRMLSLEKCQDTSVGDSAAKGISGGERKRTAIAMEMVTQAPILFLDEPTSGLDAHSALTVTHQLKTIAMAGRTVVTVLHQPSSEMFELVDDLLILFEGRIMYFGERAGVVDYLARIGHPCNMYSNPADHVFNSVLFDHRAKPVGGDAHQRAVMRAEILLDTWRQSAEAAATQHFVDYPELSPIDASQFRRTSPAITQVRYLTKRALLNAVRNKLIFNIRVAQSAFFGLLIGLIFLNTHRRPIAVQRQNFSGALFFTGVTQFLLSILSVVNVFTQERLVFLREWQGGYYGLPAYFISKNLIELPIQVILPVIYSVTSYWLLGLRQDGARFLLYTATCIVLNMCGFSFGLLLGSLFRDMSTILAALPAMFLPFLLFGGLLVNTGNSTVWLRWLQWISPIKYGYTALMRNQFDGYVVDGVPVGDDYLEEVDLGPFGIGVNIVFVVVIAFAAWISAYLALMYLTNKGGGRAAGTARRKIQQELLGPPSRRFSGKEEGRV
ncbi:hypothetical protein GGF46_005025 [Coemansia sp. RSA 552]|nr:hypothetical protein GGF46_005025 [Coemansia sp. RSA 552]